MADNETVNSDNGFSPVDVEQLGSLLTRLINEDVGDLTGGQLLQRCSDVATLRSVVDRLDVKYLADLDRRGTTEAEEGFRTAGWVAKTTHVPKRLVARRLLVANQAAAQFPLLDAAWAAGKLNYEHVAAVCREANPRIIDRLINVQPLLIELRDICLNFETWQIALARIVRLADEDGSYDPNDDIDANYLRFTPQYNGMIKIDGQLSQDNARIIMQAIDREAQSLFIKTTTDQQTINNAKTAADGTANSDTISNAAADNNSANEIAIPAPQTLRALGLVNIIRRANSAPDAPFKPLADITLVINADDYYKTNAPKVDRMSHLHCDPVISALVVDSLGTPLDAGRTIRLANQTQRRALKVRDGGCIFPGCTAPQQHCEAHHVQHFEDGGPTDLNNLASLCSHHHAVTHRPEWKMNKTPKPAIFTWTTPHGTQLTSQRHGQKPNTRPTTTPTQIPIPIPTHKRVDQSLRLSPWIYQLTMPAKIHCLTRLSTYFNVSARSTVRSFMHYSIVPHVRWDSARCPTIQQSLRVTKTQTSRSRSTTSATCARCTRQLDRLMPLRATSRYSTTLPNPRSRIQRSSEAQPDQSALSIKQPVSRASSCNRSKASHSWSSTADLPNQK